MDGLELEVARDRQSSPQKAGEEGKGAVAERNRMRKQRNTSNMATRDTFDGATQRGETTTGLVALNETQREIYTRQTADKDAYEAVRPEVEPTEKSSGNVADELVALWTVSSP